MHCRLVICKYSGKSIFLNHRRYTNVRRDQQYFGLALITQWGSCLQVDQLGQTNRTVNEMRFGFMPENRTFNAVCVLRRLHEGCHAKKKDIYVFCEPRERTMESFGVGNEEEENTRSFG